MSLATVRQRVDDWLTPRWSWLVGKQNDFYALKGRYFQGKWTHTGDVTQTDVLDGDTLADALANHPTDQLEDWRELVGTALDSLPFPARLKLDVYDGPHGIGWQAVLDVMYNGNRYRRVQNVGPETWRTKNWTNVGN